MYETELVIVKEHDRVLITCYVDSVPDASINIFKGATLLTQARDSLDLAYYILNAVCEDTGQYICKAWNDVEVNVPPAEKIVHLNVECKEIILSFFVLFLIAFRFSILNDQFLPTFSNSSYINCIIEG